MKHVVLLSGGLDSVVALFLAARDWDGRIFPLFVRYGQNAESKEAESARLAVTRAKSAFGSERFQSLRVTHVEGLTGSSLLSGEVVDEQLSEKLPSSFVPGRNLLLMSLAASYAEAVGASLIHIGLSGLGDEGTLGWRVKGGKVRKIRAAVFPDCRLDFVRAVERGINAGSSRRKFLKTPLIDLSKPRILLLARELGVEVSETWSCYSPDKEPCGLCTACRIRTKSEGFLTEST